MQEQPGLSSSAEGQLGGVGKATGMDGGSLFQLYLPPGVLQRRPNNSFLIIVFCFPPRLPQPEEKGGRVHGLLCHHHRHYHHHQCLDFLYNLLKLLRTEFDFTPPTSNQLLLTSSSCSHMPLVPGTCLPPESSPPSPSSSFSSCHQQLHLSAAAIHRLLPGTSILLCPPAPAAQEPPAALSSPTSMILLSQFALLGVLSPLLTLQSSPWKE